MLTIQNARPGDLDEIWSLVRAVVAEMNAGGNDQWGPDYPLRSDYAQALNDGQLYAALDWEGKILGVVVLNTQEDPEYDCLTGWQTAGPALVIHKLAVLPAARRQGVAAALVRFAFSLAVEWGAASVRVDTYSINRPMLRLIEKSGFRFVGEIFFSGRALPFRVFERPAREISGDSNT